MGYQPIQNWIPLDRAISSTTASTNLYNALVAAGARVVNLGQGREIVELELLQRLTMDEFQKSIRAGKLISSKYGSPSAELSAASAAWLRRLMNVDTSEDTTFTIENQGRGGLYAAFHLVASNAGFPKEGKIIIPDTSWPMIADQLSDFQLKPALYSMEKSQYAKNIRAQIEKHGDNVVAVYINSPHNPTGTRLSKQDFDQIFATLNEYNSGEHLKCRRGRKTGLIMDNPYPHAAPEIVRSENQRGLDTGLNSFRQDQLTPWIMPVSGSKFFGTAEPGFTMIAAHSTYAKPLAARLMRSVGIGFFSPFFRALTVVLHAANDDTVLDHFARLRDKYTANRAVLEKALGNSVVSGDASMTALVKIDPGDYLGRNMTTHERLDFPIDDLNDVVEYLANKHGVITVNNGMDQSALALLRLAAAEEPANYKEGINRLAAGLNELRMAPR